jgi:hypothetical protein
MSGFDLSNNYTDNLEALLRKKRSRASSSSATPSVVKSFTHIPSATITMAKSLRDYYTPAVANVPIGPAVKTRTENFKQCTSLIMMVQANQFYGLPIEDTSAHLQHFLELCDTIFIKEITPASIRLHMFPFSLAGKVKQWFY